MGTASAWTPERRARQAEAIRRWKPWEKSTGPKTAEGKARVSRNAYKGAHREHLKMIAEIGRAGVAMIAIAREAYSDRNMFAGTLVDKDFEGSERFKTAKARYDRARERFWRDLDPPNFDDLKFPIGGGDYSFSMLDTDESMAFGVTASP